MRQLIEKEKGTVGVKVDILRPSRGGHNEGVEVRFCSRVKGPLEPEGISIRQGEWMADEKSAIIMEDLEGKKSAAEGSQANYCNWRNRVDRK